MEWITADPKRETWRRLLEFANKALAFEALVGIHGTPKGSDRSNYKKQAEQMRAALIQAEQYFQAADAANLITSPNPLYYGAYSLSSAIMLLLGDGTMSLDYLRKNTKNASHGLFHAASIPAAQSCVRRRPVPAGEARRWGRGPIGAGGRAGGRSTFKTTLESARTRSSSTFTRNKCIGIGKRRRPLKKQS